jgi:hypothetical protein
MRKKICISFLFLIVGLSTYSQEQDKKVDIPEPFHIKMEVFTNGTTIFKVDTRKKAIYLDVPERKVDTSITFKWNEKTKQSFITYLKGNNRLEKIKKHSISKPTNIKKANRLFYMSIQKGDQTEEFWAEPKPKSIKDSSKPIKKVNDGDSGIVVEIVMQFMKIIKQENAIKDERR